MRVSKNALLVLWAEPRPSPPPTRTWRDWALVALLVVWSVVEAVLREDLAWRLPVLAASVVVALSLLWRRTHPLTAVTVAFGTLTVIDVARLLADDGAGLLWSVSAAVLLPYSLFRWGTGRQAITGLIPILTWLAITHLADPVSVGEVAAGYGVFLTSAALGTSVRYYTNGRMREIEEARLRERIQIARELHDTVGHHVSAIAIQAQAGRAVAPSDPERAIASLEAIEQAASRTLQEMRAMVGVLRDGIEPVLGLQPGLADIEQLAGSGREVPRIEVQIAGDFDGLNASVGVALYRIAREALTNTVRHARNATRVLIQVADEGDHVRLTVHDDGEGNSPGHSVSGYGLVGMAERASLLGGTLVAGPASDGGWTIDAVLPKGIKAS